MITLIREYFGVGLLTVVLAAVLAGVGVGVAASVDRFLEAACVCRCEAR